MKKLYLLWIIGLLLSCFSANAQNTGYADDFNSGSLAPGWYGSNRYALSVSGVELRTVATGKTFFDSYGFNLPNTINIAANPYVSIKLRGDKPFRLGVYIVDNNNNNTVITKTIPVSSKLEEYTYNFKGLMGKNNIDSTHIVRVMFVYNPQYTSSGTYYFDDLRIGDQAHVLPNLYAVPDQNIGINSAAQTIQLRGIDDGTNGTHSISLSASSSNTSLIPNPTISYTSPGSTASLQFNPASNIAGQATITVRVSAAGTTDRLESFVVTVLPNAAPLIDNVTSQSAAVNKLKTISLTGIDDGNPEVTQIITLSTSSSNTSVVPNPSVNYTSDSPNGTLSFTPSATGTSTITVTVQDNGGTVSGGVNTKSISFNVTVYGALNAAPTLSAISNQSVLANAGATNITLKGISDGDNSNQTLTFNATSSNPAVVANPTISYSPGSSTATLSYTPLSVGIDTVTVTLTDAGGNGSNNGNQSITQKFVITVNVVPSKGFVENFTEPSVNGSGWSAEGFQTLNISNGELVNTVVGKQGFPNFDAGAFAGYWYQIDQVPSLGLLDVNANPFISVKIKATAACNFVIYLWDENSRYVAAPGVAVPAGGGYVEYYFSWYGPGKLSSDNGKTFVDASKITKLLLNINPGAPYDGTVYLKELRVGDQANGRVIAPPSVSLKPIADQTIFVNSPSQTIPLSGINAGFGSTQPVSLSVLSLNTTIIPNVSVSSVNNGNAAITYTPAANKMGKAGIILTASASGSSSVIDTFYVNIVTSSPDSAATVTINTATTYQTIDGFGSHGIETSSALAVGDLGLTISRFIMFGDEFEPVNDNSDVNVINRNGFKKSAVPLKDIKTEQANGVEKFIVSVYTPPSWMKKNLSGIAPTSYGDDNDRLDPFYYDEFAEFMAAYVKIWKEQSGTDLYAISIQNELQFEEFYGGSLYTPEEYKNTVIAVGRRFAREGITTKLFGPENLYNQGGPRAYIEAINADPEARQYLGIVATHYTESASDWADARQIANQSPAKPLWVSEAGAGGGEKSVALAWPSALSTANAWYNALNYQYGQINGWVYWGFDGTLLDAGSQPSPGYYVTKNYTKYIRPGAVQVNSVSSNSNVLLTAFKNTDGTLAIVLINNGNSPVEYKLNGANLPSSFHSYLSAANVNFVQESDVNSSGVALLPAKSVTTLVSNNDVVGSGLRAYYFNNINLTDTPALVRIDPTVNFDFGNDTSPSSGVNADQYSVRWVGQVQAPVSGNYTFTTQSDDGIRLWVNGVQVINNWTLHSPTIDNGTSINLVAGQKYNIRLEYFESSGNAISRLYWTYPGQSQQIVPQNYLFPAPLLQIGNGTGLAATYFNNIDLTGSTVSRIDQTINFNWGLGSPDPAIANDNYSARWTGQVQAQYSEKYTLYTVSDDGIRVFVNGQPIINNWTDHASTENSGTIDMIAGQKYDITVEFYEHTGYAVSTLSWSSDSQYKQIVPKSQLYPTVVHTLSDIHPTMVTYPNPASAQLNIAFTAKTAQIARVQIHDLQSKVGHDKTYNIESGENVLTIPINHLSPGIHLVSLYVDRKRTVQKIIVIQ